MTQRVSSADLAACRWKNRLLLIFTPASEDASYREQSRVLAGERAALEERDLPVVSLVPEAPGLESDGARLRARFRVLKGAFTVVLVGKDGTEKERSEVPMQLGALFATIDRMPMRRRELDRGP